MLIFERDPRQRGLGTIYVPQEPRALMPTSISDEIVLVHPAQPFGSGFHQMRVHFAGAGLGATSLLGPEPAVDHYFWVQAASFFHNDVTARDLSVRLEQQSTGDGAELVTEHLAVPVLTHVAVERSFLIMPDFRLEVRANAMGAGANMFLRMMYLDLLAGEICPQL